MKETTGVVLRVTAERKLADEWALVLVAENLSPSVRPEADGFALSVPPAQAERAAAILATYESENPPPPEPIEESVASGNLVTALSVSGALILFFLGIKNLFTHTLYSRRATDFLNLPPHCTNGQGHIIIVCEYVGLDSEVLDGPQPHTCYNFPV